MTTAQRESIVQRVGRILDERVQLVRWHRQKACEAHGLPFEDGGEVRIVVEQPPAQPQPQPAAPVQSAATAPQPSALPTAWQIAKKAWPLIAGSGILSAVIGGAASQYFGQDEQPPAQTAPVEAVPASGSLLQDLEDRGFHLPPEGKADGQ